MPISIDTSKKCLLPFNHDWFEEINVVMLDFRISRAVQCITKGAENANLILMRGKEFRFARSLLKLGMQFPILAALVA